MSIEPQSNLPLSNYPAHKALTPAQTALIVAMACSLSSCEPRNGHENQQPDPANDPLQYDATDNQQLPLPGQSIRVPLRGVLIAEPAFIENTANEEKTVDETLNPAELQQRQREQLIRDLREIQQQLEEKRRQESQTEQSEPS